MVLVTGYNSINGQHYWIIQNTWGIKWGEKGFGKIARKISRGKGQHSLFSEIVYPVVCYVLKKSISSYLLSIYVVWIK